MVKNVRVWSRHTDSEANEWMIVPVRAKNLPLFPSQQYP